MSTVRRGGSGFADTAIRLAEAKAETEELARLVGEWFRHDLGKPLVVHACALLTEKLEKRDKRAEQKRAKQ